MEMLNSYLSIDWVIISDSDRYVVLRGCLLI